MHYRLALRAGKWGYFPRLSRWCKETPPIDFPTPPAPTMYCPIRGRLAAAPGDWPEKRAARAGGFLQPVLAFDVARVVVCCTSRRASQGFAETLASHILALPRRECAAYAYRRARHSVRRPRVVAPTYGFCQNAVSTVYT